ncbi:MAG TPA: signal peptide peptidase SppA [Acidobacteriota bacterium]|jgi:protease-4
MAKKKNFLQIEIKEAVTEAVPEYSLLSRKRRIHLKMLLDAIDQAAVDKRIAAILLIVRQPEIGWAQVEEVVAALSSFRSHNKPVTAYLESAGNKEYLLASAADSIYMTPAGNLNLIGLRAEFLFFRDALHWLGVEPDLLHIGKYKSAGEIFTRSGMSETQQEQTQAILDDLQDQIVDRISASRRKTREQVNAWLNNGPYSACEAKELGLLDDVLFEDQAISRMEASKLTRRELSRYRVGDGFWKRLFTYRRPQVALVVAEGMIAGGKSRRGGGQRLVCGSETIAQFLADARKRKRIRGVVLRVNSPGGSAVASDILWREVQLTSEKKPVVVSMGDVAASGGYYIATAAKKILAQRATITGSIGVIAGKFVVRDLIEKLRIHIDSLSNAANAAISSPLQPFSATEREKVRRQMEEFYRVHFVPKVVQSRGQSEERVLQLAQGRVWSGNRAHRHGLVDRIGGLRDAVEEIRALCHFPPERRIRTVVYTRRLSLLEMMTPGVMARGWIEEIRDIAGILQEQVLALLPFEIRIR